MTDLNFAPYLPLSAIIIFAIIIGFFCLFPKRNWVYLVFTAFVSLVLANPQKVTEERKNLPQKVAIVIDNSRSNSSEAQKEITTQAADNLMIQLNKANIEVEKRYLTDTAAAGTSPFTDHKDLFEGESAKDLGATFMISDTLWQDIPQQSDSPIFVLNTEGKNRYDRILDVIKAPEYAVVKETTKVNIQIKDSRHSKAPLRIFIADQKVVDQVIPTNEELSFNLKLPKAGPMSLRFETDSSKDERTDQNNQKTLLIKGIRDNLNVLLVSGVPHNGTQSLRKLLKSDPSVNMIHFTILRESFSESPVDQEDMSLVPFPVHELFMKRLHDFDLVIFDHFVNRGFLRQAYIKNLLKYSANGGAMLFVTGPDFTSYNGLGHGLLQKALPIKAGRYQNDDNRFNARLTSLGKNHPITQDFKGDIKNWATLGQLSESTLKSDAQLLMHAEGKPLLAVGEFKKGRTAMFLSDHLWLWDRAKDSGQMHELLRRLSHWLMKEPELEHKAFSFTKDSNGKTKLTLKGLTSKSVNVIITTPRQEQEEITLYKKSGYSKSLDLSDKGLYIARFNQKGKPALYGYYQQGQIEDKEWLDSDKTALNLLIKQSQGTLLDVSNIDKAIDFKLRFTNKNAAGKGWLSLKGKERYEVISQTSEKLFSPLLTLLISLIFAALMWVRRS